MKKLIAALVPAHGEEKVIGKTLEALLHQFDADDIYVVDDKSKDRTAHIAAKYTPNVLKLQTNLGKAGALNAALREFQIADRYEYIMFMDADTQPSPDFVSETVPHMVKDPSVQCVVGRVQGLGGSWVAKYRIWEYSIAHSVHKRAQAYLKSILVVPGCATVYRAEIFNHLEIPAGTLTEDMDFTFLLHRKGFSNMVFESKAVVYTQDPPTLRDLIKQINRWYTGFWQAVKKHELPWHGQNLDYEVAILAIEGLLNSLVSIMLLALLPTLWKYQSLSIMAIPAFVDLFIFFLPTLIWTSWRTRDYTLPFYFIPFYFLRWLTSLLFLKAFFAAYLMRGTKYTWNTKRYSINT